MTEDYECFGPRCAFSKETIVGQRRRFNDSFNRGDLQTDSYEFFFVSVNKDPPHARLQILSAETDTEPKRISRFGNYFTTNSPPSGRNLSSKINLRIRETRKSTSASEGFTHQNCFQKTIAAPSQQDPHPWATVELLLPDFPQPILDYFPELHLNVVWVRNIARDALDVPHRHRRRQPPRHLLSSHQHPLAPLVPSRSTAA